MARKADSDMQLVSLPLDSPTIYLIAQAMKKEGITSRPIWLRAAIKTALERSKEEQEK